MRNSVSAIFPKNRIMRVPGVVVFLGTNAPPGKRRTNFDKAPPKIGV